ncbi:MAG: hypothetical protein NZ602_15035 [Thermoguttaceae bacterium]|nr:hypothetical protein [Thermoguttaceae bacterium]MDW8039191.1 multiheme c-type cytochrome [Thermoguttaceae bacterium]
MVKLSRWIIGTICLAGLLVGGCQEQAHEKPPEAYGKVSLPAGQAEPSKELGMAGGIASAGSQSKDTQEALSKALEPSFQPPKWWDQTRSQTQPLPETSEGVGKSRYVSPSKEVKEVAEGNQSEGSASPAEQESVPEGFRPNPLREGGIQPEPLRPDATRVVPPPLPSERGTSLAKGEKSFLPGGGSNPSLAEASGLSGAPSGGGSGSSARPVFDPYKEHGHFFAGWPKPKLALVLTGARNGYIEPCGCAGKDRMKGGISRLHSMLLELREKRSWPIVALDVGGISKGTGLQGVLKFHALADAMRKMGYEAVAFGLSDLKYDLGDLIAVASEVDGKPGLFISSNVALLSWDAGFTGKPRIIQAAGLKIGVIAILGREFQNQILSKEILFEDPEKVVRHQAAELQKQCDLLILLAHASRQESVDLAKKVPGFDLVVTSGGAPEPPLHPQQIEGQKAWLIEVGEKGMYAVVVGLYEDPNQPRRYQRVVLDSRYPDSEPMRQIMVAYQEQLKDLGLKGLGIQPVRHPRQELNGPFVGSKQCQSCHEPSYKIWRRSGHAKAWQTLVQADPPRHHDPECISCHVVGWNPQKYFPYQGGFWDEKQTPHLVDVGCESCHGPGGKHVDAELGRLGSNDTIRQKYREAVRLPLAEAEKTCLECHDLDNSPDFNFKTYWPKVEHYED